MRHRLKVWRSQSSEFWRRSATLEMRTMH